MGTGVLEVDLEIEVNRFANHNVTNVCVHSIYGNLRLEWFDSNLLPVSIRSTHVLDAIFAVKLQV